MKRTIGKFTYVFEVRDYVVSLFVAVKSYGYGIGINFIDIIKIGDLEAFCCVFIRVI